MKINNVKLLEKKPGSTRVDDLQQRGCASEFSNTLSGCKEKK